MRKFLVLALAVGAAVSAPEEAAARACRVEVVRTAPERAPWSASCGSVSVPNPPPRVSANQLSGVPLCSVTGQVPCQTGALGVPVVLAPGDVPEGPVGVPACVDSQPAEWVRWGFVDIHRSCFRTLSQADRADLATFASSATGAGPGTPCFLERFEGLATPPPNVPDQVPWANDFDADYPDVSASPPNPAGSVYEAFKVARTANDDCLQALNPALAQRMRQAMGTVTRPGTGNSFRPQLSCSEHEVFDCQAQTPGKCDELRERLNRIYAEAANPEDPREILRSIADRSAVREAGCQPAAPANRLLGLTEGAAHPGRVDPGAPRIHLFETTARYHSSAQAASTVFHEFLHAAGGRQGANHNHGPVAGGLPPPGDQVYACEAVAFQGAFPTLSSAQISAACRTCAGGGAGTRLCRGPGGLDPTIAGVCRR